MAGDLFWVLVVAAVVFAAYLLCNCGNMAGVMASMTGPTFPIAPAPIKPAPIKPAPIAPAPIARSNVQLHFPRRYATLTVEHNEPLLGSLFSREVEALPDGISREDFERQVAEYQQQHLKEVEIKIPRSMNFNYEKYAVEQEQMRLNVSAAASEFIQREERGAISEKLAKGVPSTQTLAPRSFMKKAVAKRR